MEGYTKSTVNYARFMGSLAKCTQASLIFLGIPLDLTVSFRPGTRFAPQEVRMYSYVLEDYSLSVGGSLQKTAFADIGDVDLPFGNLKRSFEVIEDLIGDIVGDGKKFLAVGGEHLITYPVIKGVIREIENIVVLQVDAHMDTRDSYEGEAFSHATVIRRIAELIGPERIYQAGIRSATREEYLWARDNTHLYPHDVLRNVGTLVKELKGKKVYLSIDIDVVDPAYAPGVGTPEPGGITSMELFDFLYSLKEVEFIGGDIVEISPPYDREGITSLLGARIARDLIIQWGGGV